MALALTSEVSRALFSRAIAKLNSPKSTVAFVLRELKADGHSNGCLHKLMESMPDMVAAVIAARGGCLRS